MTFLKNMVLTCVALTAMCGSQWIFAHAGGHDEVAEPTEQQILSTAARYVAKLIKDETPVAGSSIDKAWLTADTSTLHEKALRYYVVKFTKKGAAKPLFIKMDSRGLFVEANYDGNFDEGK